MTDLLNIVPALSIGFLLAALVLLQRQISDLRHELDMQTVGARLLELRVQYLEGDL